MSFPSRDISISSCSSSSSFRKEDPLSGFRCFTTPDYANICKRGWTPLLFSKTRLWIAKISYLCREYSLPAFQSLLFLHLFSFLSSPLSFFSFSSFCFSFFFFPSSQFFLFSSHLFISCPLPLLRLLPLMYIYI